MPIHEPCQPKHQTWMHWVHVHSVLIHFKFCPKCGVKVRSFSRGRCETTTTPFSLPNFQTFKSQKESRRKTLFARKTPAGRKKRKFHDEIVKINVEVMGEKDVNKRGETLPLKVPSTASAEDFRLAAVKKHTLLTAGLFIHNLSTNWPSRMAVKLNTSLA